MKGGPRKVIVGTTIYRMWGEYPGLERRLAQLGELIDAMAAEARQVYGRSVDICALPEEAVTSGNGAMPLPFDGPVADFFAAKAREHDTYIVVAMGLTESGAAETVTRNSCVLVDRQGRQAGVYHKVHVTGGEVKLGRSPGLDFPVFECDFGKLGIQICYDINYDDGWQTLGRKGAELVVWSTASPGQIRPAMRGLQNNYYVLTSGAITHRFWIRPATASPLSFRPGGINGPSSRRLTWSTVASPGNRSLRTGMS